MKMRQVESVDVPAGGEVLFKPHGLHVMLFGLKLVPPYSTCLSALSRWGRSCTAPVPPNFG